MEFILICVVVFLFLLAIFDLSVGVSNDAVNFLNSALGSKAAPFKTIIIVASAGVFIGAAMSNGMMDIARHGIFQPEHLSFYDIICIFMAVMVTDIILLDIFNVLGMPTSTTVSMVFELLGATFVVALLRLASDNTGLSMADLINTEKALSVILGIFLSVAIAFFFGTLVQFLARMLFTFNYRTNLKWTIGLFGGICATAIVYFLLIKGAKDLAFMTPEVKGWIKENTWLIIGCCLAGFTLLMQLLHILGVNVLKVIVLLGTFSLATAFAGNDLVNFIGVPLSGLSSLQDYAANGSGDPHSFFMGSLNGPANTSVWFLVGAGLVMVASLATSRKARKVAQTEIGLGSQSGGDEMFGSSRLARRLVRWSLSLLAWIRRVTPAKVRRWFNSRFDTDETIMDSGAAFDLIRASVNLVLAAALIAAGTSLKLPLSTTFVTFMVAMGTSLSDRAWGRESAVFRITGVFSVIGGWFITAGAAFIGAALIVLLMHFGGHWVMLALALATIFIIIRSNRRFRHAKEAEKGDVLFQTILATKEPEKVWPMLEMYIRRHQQSFLEEAAGIYSAATHAFSSDDGHALEKFGSSLHKMKYRLKNDRHKETLCLRQSDRRTALEKSAWFHLSNNCCLEVFYCLERICEGCREHTANNLTPLPSRFTGDFDNIRTRMEILFNDIVDMMQTGSTETVRMLRSHCDMLKDDISETYHALYSQLSGGRKEEIGVLYVYLNTLQETREMVSALRKYLRAVAKLSDTAFSGNTLPAPV